MAERRSALAHLPAGAVENARVIVSETRPGSILQIQAWPESLSTTKAVIAELLGIQTPEIGSAAVIDGVCVAAIAPGRFVAWGETDDLAQRFEAALPAADGTVTDLSHGRTMLRLEGAAADVLAKCVALDLDPTVFPPGRVAQTAIHHIDVLIHRRSESSFDLWALRSFAEALTEWLLDAGRDLGAGFRD